MTSTLELLDRIRSDEDEQTEFKLLLDNKDKVAAEIVALANARGGWVIFGVDDTGAIVGVSNPADLETDLMNLCRQNCIPALRPQFEIVEVSGKAVLVLKVTGPDKPYKTNKGVYYIRVGTTKREATQQELMRIFQLKGAVYFDESPVHGTSLDDLDFSLFAAYYQRQFGAPVDEAGVALPDLLQNMRLLIDVAGALRLTVAGLLLFGKAPHRHMPHARLSAVRFVGKEMGEQIADRREITGPLPHIINHAQDFLRSNTRQAAEITGFRREDRPQYHVFALREAVVNAIAHRDYSIIGSQIRLFIFDDRVEVHSPGRLPNTVTLENIRYGAHYERNPRLCTILTHLGYMSDIGTGIPRMIRLTRELSGREPELEVRDEQFTVRIHAAWES